MRAESECCCKHHQPNSWHSTLQETNPWQSVRNSWGLTRKTHFSEEKVGQPSAVRPAKAWNPKLKNSGLTSMSSVSICLLRPKYLRFLSQLHVVYNTLSIRTICPHIYYRFLPTMWTNMAFVSKIIYFENRKKNTKFCTVEFNLKCVKGVV